LSPKFCQVYNNELETDSIALATKTTIAFGQMENLEVLHLGNSTNFYKLPVEYGGFCPYAVVTRGLIVPGDKNIGLIRYSDRLISFESQTSAVEFMKQPELYQRAYLALWSK